MAFFIAAGAINPGNVCGPAYFDDFPLPVFPSRKKQKELPSMLTISKTEAVNRIMQALDGTIISDINDSQNDNVLQAIRAIDTATEKIQIENEWNFNLDGPRTLTTDGDGEVIVPSDFIYIKFHSWSGGSVFNLSVKNGKVWDRRQGTSQVPGTVEIIGSRKFSYDECPSAIQNYIIEKAKFEFLGLHTHLSAPRISIYEAERKEAYTAALKWDAQQQFGAMDLSPGQRQSLRFNNGRAGWWNGF